VVKPVLKELLVILAALDSLEHLVLQDHRDQPASPGIKVCREHLVHQGSGEQLDKVAIQEPPAHQEASEVLASKGLKEQQETLEIQEESVYRVQLDQLEIQVNKVFKAIME